MAQTLRYKDDRQYLFTLRCEQKEEHGGHAIKSFSGECHIGVRKGVRKEPKTMNQGNKKKPCNH